MIGKKKVKRGRRRDQRLMKKNNKKGGIISLVKIFELVILL